MYERHTLKWNVINTFLSFLRLIVLNYNLKIKLNLLEDRLCFVYVILLLAIVARSEMYVNYEYWFNLWLDTICL